MLREDISEMLGIGLAFILFVYFLEHPTWILFTLTALFWMESFR